MLSLKSIFSFIISPCLSPSSLRPIPLALSSVILSCPCSSLSPLLLLSHLFSFLFSLPSFPPALPHLTYSHSPQLKDPILLELCCLYALKKHFSNLFLAVPLLLSSASAPSSKQWMTPVAVAISSYPCGSSATSEGGETRAPPSAPLIAYPLWSSQPPSTLLPPTSHDRRAHWQLS